jgi:outer membrane protein assembly factor BamB
MTKFFIFILFIFSFTSWSQTEFFNSKILIPENQLGDFYSSISVDNTQVYFNANNYTVYGYDKKTGVLNWSYYRGTKSNIAPKGYQNYVFVGIRDSKWMQLNAKTGDTIQTLKIEDHTTQPFFKNDVMYGAAISPEIGGVILAYDIKKNEIVWQKYIGHGVSYQPYFLKDKIVANYENQYWFELDYDGNALDKSENCYSKNTETPFEERFCNIHYDILNQYNKDVAVNNVTIEETKYHYAQNAAIILKGNKLKIVNEKNKVKKEIVLDKILTLLETDVLVAQHNKYIKKNLQKNK